MLDRRKVVACLGGLAAYAALLPRRLWAAPLVDAPVARAAMRDLLLPGLWEVDGRYPAIECQWALMFKQTESPPEG